MYIDWTSGVFKAYMRRRGGSYMPYDLNSLCTAKIFLLQTDSANIPYMQGCRELDCEFITDYISWSKAGDITQM
ncbi:MAG: hypothetical protein AYK19_00890 [Theionarchaea archaeon DG-70-1]|nr:MAG: hypothetical protein AYK19_00890 [Theionarchaea archaeon DG-70-1]